MTIMPGRDAVPAVRLRGRARAPARSARARRPACSAPIVNIVASFQAAEAMKLLSGNKAAINRELLMLDVWENTNRRVKVAPLKGRKGECPCCAQRQFEWLDGEHGTQTTTLCGRNAVQVSHRAAGQARLRPSWPTQLRAIGHGDVQQVPAQVPA